MAKLDSKKNPLVLKVSEESKVDEVIQICNHNGWHFILGFESGEEDLSDLQRKLNPRTIVNSGEQIGRNEMCACGSGKKFKKCCQQAAQNIA